MCSSTLGYEKKRECVPKLSAHGAINYEVYSTIYQSKSVHRFSKIEIHVIEELCSEYPAHEGQQSTREFGEQKQPQHSQQHFGRSVVRSVVIHPVLKPLSSLVGFVEDANQSKTQGGEGDARYQLGDDAEEPEIDLLQETVMSLSNLAEVHSVQYLTVLSEEFGHGEGHVDRNAEYRAGDVGCHDCELCPRHRTPVAAAPRKTDGHESPDCDSDRQPDGYRVIHHREVGVKEGENCPTIGELLVLADVLSDVVVVSERKVGEHHHHVRHGETGQYGVRRGHHVLSGQHDDVQDVGSDSENADDETQVAVDSAVSVAEHRQVLPVIRGVFLKPQRGRKGGVQK